jgi:hypothetical protein
VDLCEVLILVMIDMDMDLRWEDIILVLKWMVMEVLREGILPTCHQMKIGMERVEMGQVHLLAEMVWDLHRINLMMIVEKFKSNRNRENSLHL